MEGRTLPTLLGMLEGASTLKPVPCPSHTSNARLRIRLPMALRQLLAKLTSQRRSVRWEARLRRPQPGSACRVKGDRLEERRLGPALLLGVPGPVAEGAGDADAAVHVAVAAHLDAHGVEALALVGVHLGPVVRRQGLYLAVSGDHHAAVPEVRDVERAPAHQHQGADAARGERVGADGLLPVLRLGPVSGNPTRPEKARPRTWDGADPVALETQRYAWFFPGEPTRRCMRSSVHVAQVKLTAFHNVTNDIQ